MTGDGKAIGTKFGIAFVGRWVWNMKDYIDVGFMKLFYADYLFNDHETYNDPDETGAQLAKERVPIVEKIEKLKAQVAEMQPVDAAKSLLADEEQEEFYEQLQIIDRMGRDEEFQKAVVSHFNN